MCFFLLFRFWFHFLFETVCFRNNKNVPHSDILFIPFISAMSSSDGLRRLMLSRVSDALTDDPVEIFPRIFLGSLQAALDVDKLRERDIQHVLTVAGRLKVSLPAPEFTHKQVDIADHPAADILSIIPECLAFIDTAIGSCNDFAVSESSDQIPRVGVLVHCASGISRSVSICCAVPRLNCKVVPAAYNAQPKAIMDSVATAV